jgi:hypothetical protein
MSGLDSFRAARWLRTANLIGQAVLLLTFLGGLNYLASDHAWRLDLTRYRRYSLSPETRSYLRDLRRPVHLVVTSTSGTNPVEITPEVRGLLSEYVYATEGSRDGAVTVEYVDVYFDRRKVERYGIDQAGAILLRCGDNRTLLTLKDLYRFDQGRRQAFVGEQAVTAAILDVSNPEPKQVYFLVGHGEMRPDDPDPVRGLSAARDFLRQHDFAVGTLELEVARQIPANAALLVLVNPQSRYTAREQELLRQYLGAGAGRLLLLLPPGPGVGLDDLLLDWGVRADPDLLRDTGAGNVTEDGDLLIGTYRPHPITQTLLDYRIPLRVGAARSLRPAPRAPGSGLTVVTLAAASPTAWGEVGYRQRGLPPFDPAVDVRGRPDMDPPNQLGLAVASERVAVRGNLPFSVPVGRLVAIGTGDLISNQRIANPGAEALLLGAVNWTVGRETQLNVPARPIERFQLSLSAGDFLRLRYTLMLALPGATALFGLAVYWARRR